MLLRTRTAALAVMTREFTNRALCATPVAAKQTDQCNRAGQQEANCLVHAECMGQCTERFETWMDARHNTVQLWAYTQLRYPLSLAGSVPSPDGAMGERLAASGHVGLASVFASVTTRDLTCVNALRGPLTSEEGQGSTFPPSLRHVEACVDRIASGAVVHLNSVAPVVRGHGTYQLPKVL